MKVQLIGNSLAYRGIPKEAYGKPMEAFTHFEGSNAHCVVQGSELIRVGCLPSCFDADYHYCFCMDSLEVLEE